MLALALVGAYGVYRAPSAFVDIEVNPSLELTVDVYKRQAQESVVNMRNKANSAFEAIDALAAIDTPDAMKDLQTNYVDGCNKLKDALNSYIDLYTEISSATEEAPFDFSAYDGRVKEIQDAYNEGIDKLKAADEEALKLNED